MATKPKAAPAKAKLRAVGTAATAATAPVVKKPRVAAAPVAKAVTEHLLPAAPKAPPAPVVVKRSDPPVASATLKMKDLVDAVVEKTGAKKAQTREIVEAALAVLGEALSKGDTINLPPLGRAKVSRATDAASGKAMTVKLRRPLAGAPVKGQGKGPGKPALADAED